MEPCNAGTFRVKGTVTYIGLIHLILRDFVLQTIYSSSVPAKTTRSVPDTSR